MKWSGLFFINRGLKIYLNHDKDHFIIFSIFFLFSQSDVVFYNYLDSSAVSSDSPNWQAYLIRPDYLVWLRDHSTHWRATCRYNTDGTVYTDYLRASFQDFDIVRVTPTVTSSCQKYELVNIRGNECTNCTAATWYLKGAYPLHIDSSSSHGCDFDGSQSGDAVGSEDNFGFYHAVNSKFRCTSSSDATTQFWFGSKWLHKLVLCWWRHVQKWLLQEQSAEQWISQVYFPFFLFHLSMKEHDMKYFRVSYTVV